MRDQLLHRPRQGSRFPYPARRTGCVTRRETAKTMLQKVLHFISQSIGNHRRKTARFATFQQQPSRGHAQDQYAQIPDVYRDKPVPRRILCDDVGEKEGEHEDFGVILVEEQVRGAEVQHDDVGAQGTGLDALPDGAEHGDNLVGVVVDPVGIEAADSAGDHFVQ